ncbi:MAG: hypothetical protein ACK47B_12715 [Armatimonadota bacterium]
MADYDEVARQAKALPAAEQARLARELSGGRTPLAELGTFSPRQPAPQSVAWLKAERGHAVLATDTGPAEGDIPAGWEAIAGMWKGADEGGAQ